MNTFFAGLDWASQIHAVCVIDECGGVCERFEITHDAEGLADLKRRLIHFGRPPIAIERPSGLVVDTLVEAGLPPEAVQLVQTTDRAAVGRLIAMPEFVDVIIPRGGKGLIERISAEARVPVIKHLDGVCHVYLDDGADPAKARLVVTWNGLSSSSPSAPRRP